MITTFRELKDFFNTCSHEYIGILYKTPNLNFSIELLNKYGSLWFVTNFITEITKVYSSNNLFDIIENLRL